MRRDGLSGVSLDGFDQFLRRLVFQCCRVMLQAFSALVLAQDILFEFPLLFKRRRRHLAFQQVLCYWFPNSFQVLVPSWSKSALRAG